MNSTLLPETEKDRCPGLRGRRLLQVLFAGMAVAAGLLAGAAGAADPEAGAVAPLRVGVSPVFPPMVFKQGKALAGVEVDLARAFGERLGRPVTFIELEWADQTEALVSGKIDIIMSSMSMTFARNSVLSFTRPYLKVGQMALVRREDQHQHTLGWKIPAKTKVGVIKATTGDFLIQREFSKAKRKTYENSSEAARALLRGKIDLFIADSTLVWHLAGTHAAEGLTAVPSVLTEELLAWGVRRGNDELLKAANEFIARAAEDGTLTQTFRRWMAVQ